jgi:hypothetical protein
MYRIEFRYKEFSCETFFKIVMYIFVKSKWTQIPSICSGGPVVLTVKCQHRFNLQWIHRDTYRRLKALYYFTFAIALDSWIFQSILITTGENFHTACLWAMTDRKVIMRPKTNIQSKIYESFLFRAGGKKYWWSQET